MGGVGSIFLIAVTAPTLIPQTTLYPGDSFNITARLVNFPTQADCNADTKYCNNLTPDNVEAMLLLPDGLKVIDVTSTPDVDDETDSRDRPVHGNSGAAVRIGNMQACADGVVGSGSRCDFMLNFTFEVETCPANGVISAYLFVNTPETNTGPALTHPQFLTYAFHCVNDSATPEDDNDEQFEATGLFATQLGFDTEFALSVVRKQTGEFVSINHHYVPERAQAGETLAYILDANMEVVGAVQDNSADDIVYQSYLNQGGRLVDDVVSGGLKQLRVRDSQIVSMYDVDVVKGGKSENDLGEEFDVKYFRATGETDVAHAETSIEPYAVEQITTGSLKGAFVMLGGASTSVPVLFVIHETITNALASGDCFGDLDGIGSSIDSAVLGNTQLQWVEATGDLFWVIHKTSQVYFGRCSLNVSADGNVTATAVELDGWGMPPYRWSGHEGHFVTIADNPITGVLYVLDYTPGDDDYFELSSYNVSNFEQISDTPRRFNSYQYLAWSKRRELLSMESWSWDSIISTYARLHAVNLEDGVHVYIRTVNSVLRFRDNDSPSCDDLGLKLSNGLCCPESGCDGDSDDGKGSDDNNDSDGDGGDDASDASAFAPNVMAVVAALVALMAFML